MSGLHKVRLTGAEVPFWVDVSLVHGPAGWMAISQFAGDLEIGLGLTARAATIESLREIGAIGYELASSGTYPDELLDEESNDV